MLSNMSLREGAETMRTSTTSLPPGPRLPALIQTGLFTLNAPAFMERCGRRYGDCFTVRFVGLGGCSVFVSDADAIREIFRGDTGLFHAGECNAVLKPLMGTHSVLLLDESAHLRQRRLMLPSFHGERMQSYRELIADVTHREIDTWPVGKPFPLLARTQAITLDVIMRAVFGIEEGGRFNRLRESMRRLVRLAFGPGMAVLPMLERETRFRRAPWARFRRALDESNAVIFEEIGTRRSDPSLTERQDVLSMLLQARDDEGNAMTDAEIRDELVTLLVAGHETSATTLAWAFDLMLHNPETLAKLQAEVDDGESEEYLDAVIKETLRLRPVAPLVGRKLTAPWQLNGYEIPEGTLVAPCVYLTQRRPELHRDPLAFSPERFLEDAVDPYTWLPFGGGVRRCLGASFATFEMKTVIPAIMQRARLRPAAARLDSIKRGNILFIPAKGTRVIAKSIAARPPAE
jgi:cytochrome P450